MRKPFNPRRSLELDWVITRIEATRGWRRTWLRIVKWIYEIGI